MVSETKLDDRFPEARFWLRVFIHYLQLTATEMLEELCFKYGKKFKPKLLSLFKSSQDQNSQVKTVNFSSAESFETLQNILKGAVMQII